MEPTPPRGKSADLRLQLTSMFVRFFESERTSSFLLLGCFGIALAIANSPLHTPFAHFWERTLGGLTLEQWVNDGLMTVFFLLIGLELERELYVGELSSRQRALLPAVAAVGGMLVPGLIHWTLNSGTPAQRGAGIPTATDIAFVLGALALLGSRVPAGLKVFVVAFAVMDDLGAVLIIGVFYSNGFALEYALAAMVVLAFLAALNRVFRVMALSPYLIGGALLWWLLLRSGVHPTLAGVAVAFAVPFLPGDGQGVGPSHRLERALQAPVAFGIVPLFALANSGLRLDAELMAQLATPNAAGIMLGLVVGKPVGVATASLVAVYGRVCTLPSGTRWPHVVGAGMLGGIGFTMSLFIANLAFPNDPASADAAKAAVFLGSIVSAVIGYSWLNSRMTTGPGPGAAQ